ncbi:hypothetical protein ACN08Y_01565 [Rothia sp. P5764]|uniref:hypothetical protein n=1 Tax=Rothia sp. P5764 TaxID=3402654 RepID=UPI003AC045DB
MESSVFPVSSRDIPVFARGFYLTRSADQVVVPETYENQPLGDTWSYFHDFLTSPSVARDGAAFLVIHGNFESLQTFARDQVAEVALAKFRKNQQDFYEFLDDLVGRWAMFVSLDGENLEVFHDAFGSRVVYYDELTGDLSSHVDFIARNRGYVDLGNGTYYQAVSANFDQTKSEHIYALIPNHRLSINGEAVETRRYWPRYENPYTSLSHEQKIEKLMTYWGSVVQQYTRDYDSLVFSLSGGEDSRANLAMASDYLDQFELFTYATHRTDGESYWYKSIRKDYEIVQQIVGMVPANHRFMFREESTLEAEPQLSQVVDINTTGQHGKWLLPLYRQEFPGMRHLHMRGTLFEIGKALYHDLKDQGELEDMKRLFDLHSRKSQQDQALKDAFFAEKVARLELEPKHYRSYLPSDIFYWEMRQGRWFSETLNESDLAFDSFIPINCRRIVMLLLSFTLSERRASFIFDELINRTYPVLNFIGKNNLKNLYEQVRDSGRVGFYTVPSRVVMHYSSNGAQYREAVLPDAESTFGIPRGKFTEGNYVTARYVATAPMPRAVVRWQSPYQKAAGRGVFEYRVYKNGILMLTQDGAETAEVTEFGIGDLRPGDNVQLEIRVLKSQQSNSWPAASRVEMFDVVSL